MIGEDELPQSPKMPIPPTRGKVGTYSDLMLHSLFRVLRFSVVLIIAIGLIFMFEPLL